jgi:hypothetical protein
MTMPSSPRLRRSASSSLRLGLGTALAVCAALPFAASAHAASTEIVPAGSGMTMPAGIAETTDGSIWIADSIKGVCRVDTSDPAGLVASDYCEAEPAGAVAFTRSGPSVPSQMAFDPISSNFFVAEGSSKGAGVWRMHWNAAGNVIDSAEQVVFAGDNRVFALALGTNNDDDPATPAFDPTVYVDFNGRDDATIHRLDDAGNATPADISATDVVGVSGTAGIVSMANIDGALYLAEPGGVTRIAAPNAVDHPVAESVAGFPLDAGVPNALAADVANDRVYAGTANPDGLDRVDVLTVSTGSVSTYETGFALVTGLGVRSSGSLLVADDPLASAGAPESVGQSRLLEVALQSANMPAVTITSGPDVYSSATAARFTFSSAVDASFTCSLDGAAAAPCGDAVGPNGSQSYTGLADGLHVFEVRASAAGRAARYSFTVDTVAPVATVDNPAADKVTDRDTLRARFSSDEFGVTYTCMLDSAPVHGCTPPVWLSFAIGTHTFAVTPTDLAGNIGATATWTFERIPAPTPPPKPDNSGPGNASDPVAADSSSGPGPGPAAESTASSIVPAACRKLAGQTVKGSYKLAGRVLTVRITPTAGARYAKLTLRPRAKAKGSIAKLAVKAVTGTKARNVRITLTRAQAARLRARSTMLTVGYGTCATTIGAGTELAATAAKSSAR